MRCLSPFLFASVLLWIPAASAQQGDKPNEVQQRVPADWKIPPAPVLSAEDELRTFAVAPGFRIELMAAEPLVGDPVAATFAPDGKLWVVEMLGYMKDIDATDEHAPVGSVAVLEDTNGDGRFDKRTVFMDHLVLPRAISLVGDGALVAEPPHLWFARDTDGDGVADQKVELASDYGGVGNPEHMANGLVWMMDNRIYSANYSTRFRFEGEGKFSADPTITRGQWGITQDDTGRIYYNSNSDPLRVDAVPSAYFKRNPRLTNPRGINVQLAPADLPTWPGRVTPGVNRGYKTLRPNGTLSAVTAACSPVIYRGGLFPAEFHGDAFICEPSGNLIKRIRLNEQNGRLVGTNAYDQTEFLTSTDERFRPVSIYNGPDGALWIVDMYRGVIQHRTYVTSYLRAQVKERGLEEGRGLGRIWRIVPDTTPSSVAGPNLARANTAGLVSLLASPSGWARDAAQRLLVENRDSEAVAMLQTSIRLTGGPALARLHALWTLEGIGALDRASVLIALRDPDDRVQAAAIRLSERWLTDSTEEDGIYQQVIRLALDPDATPSPAVVLQSALSLGETRGARKLEVMATFAERYGDRPFIADALVSGLAGNEIAFVERAGSRLNATNAGPAIAAAVRSQLHSTEPAALAQMLSLLSATDTLAWARSAILDGIEDFVPRRADGAQVIGALPAEPTALLKLAEQKETPDGLRAAKLVQHLRWPGKTGDAAAATPLTEEESKLFDRGRAQYAALCANCHQPDGQGLAGLAPPLVSSRWVLGPEQLVASIVLCGKEDEGKVMPSLRTVLDDQAIASVLTFVRNSWGHTAKPIHVDTVARIRAETSSRTEPFHEAELVEALHGMRATPDAAETN